MAIESIYFGIKYVNVTILFYHPVTTSPHFYNYLATCVLTVYEI